MTIAEAIKNIILISKNDDSLLVDPKRFMAHLRDLSPEYNKELNILQNGLTERILKLSLMTIDHKEVELQELK